MKTVTSHNYTTFEEKKSSFTAYLCPVDDFKSLLGTLKSEHPKARHFVTASRSINHQEQIEESFSDDGEPKGTSGMPTLKVLRGNDLINVGIITVRYFGGIKLGTGGLVRAYSDAANHTISAASLVPYKKEEYAEFLIAYVDLQHAQYWAKKHEIKILERDFQSGGIALHVSGERESLAQYTQKLRPLN